MTKKDLIRTISIKTGQSQYNAAVILDGLLDTVEQAMASGQRVAIPGFGTFEVGQRKARTGRNPLTGEEMKVPAKAVAKFTPGKRLKDAALLSPPA